MAVDGTWNITVNSPMGAQESTLVLASGADGALTGTASGEDGPQEIADGKVDGNNVSWTISITKPMSITLEFSGAVDGDTIAGDVKAGMFPSFPFSGARA